MNYHDDTDPFHVPFPAPQDASAEEDDDYDYPEDLRDVIESLPQYIQDAFRAYDETQEQEEEESRALAPPATEPPPSSPAPTVDNDQPAARPNLGDMNDMLQKLDQVGDVSAYNGRDVDALLHAQAQMLNNLFARTLYKAHNTGSHLTYMELALKIQRQMVETLRVRGGIQYMSSFHKKS